MLRDWSSGNLPRGRGVHAELHAADREKRFSTSSGLRVFKLLRGPQWDT